MIRVFRRAMAEMVILLRIIIVTEMRGRKSTARSFTPACLASLAAETSEGGRATKRNRIKGGVWILSR